MLLSFPGAHPKLHYIRINATGSVPARIASISCAWQILSRAQARFFFQRALPAPVLLCLQTFQETSTYLKSQNQWISERGLGQWRHRRHNFELMDAKGTIRMLPSGHCNPVLYYYTREQTKYTIGTSLPLSVKMTPNEILRSEAFTQAGRWRDCHRQTVAAHLDHTGDGDRSSRSRAPVHLANLPLRTHQPRPP